jgi:hypothetical protein
VKYFVYHVCLLVKIEYFLQRRPSKFFFFGQTKGVKFRGLSIPECQKVLSAAIEGGESLPEGLILLLLNGKVWLKMVNQ